MRSLAGPEYVQQKSSLLGCQRSGMVTVRHFNTGSHYQFASATGTALHLLADGFAMRTRLGNRPPEDGNRHRCTIKGPSNTTIRWVV